MTLPRVNLPLGLVTAPPGSAMCLLDVVMSTPSKAKSGATLALKLFIVLITILEGATSILASISPIIGEFGCRNIDTRIKQRPTRTDVKNIFDLLCDMGLIESAPSWCSPETPKPEYKNDRASAFWDVPVYAEKTEVRANRIDARVVDKQKKKVLLLEMSCPWMANRKQKEEEKTSKYAPLRWEIRQQYPHYKIAQYNIIIDVLGGVSRKTLDSIKELVGVRADKILLDMQKAVISSTLNIARSFKVLTAQDL
ncbi:uncharacterized protein [Pocillopora verrucosa]|uniref:uncharacterized protein n=1 Tax=Pocillopora verrucosa TaxID=203993 RepID=UPI00333EEA27